MRRTRRSHVSTCINFRPLTPVNNDPNDLNILTPDISLSMIYQRRQWNHTYRGKD